VAPPLKTIQNSLVANLATLRSLQMETNPLSSDPTTPPLLRWYSMNGREQAVWSAAYIACSLDPARAAQSADKAVLALRSLAIDESQFIGPEHDAARYCSDMTFERFSGWYPIALKIASRNQILREPSADELRQAFETYRMSTTDFF